MKVNTNSWNRIRYTFYAPFYDFLVSNIFKSSRAKSIGQLNIKPDEKVLVVGAGTGLDLPYIHEKAKVFATDITPAMVNRIESENKKLKLDLETRVMDGQKLDFPSQFFDKIILHLIIAVIPDPEACLRECERVLKKDGEITIFDKFVKKDTKVSIARKFFNVFTNLFFSDITRNAHAIVAATSLKIVEEIPANLNGNFKILKLKK